jgi:hypothetical protein
VADFFHCALLSFGTFALAAKRSSLSTYLAAMASEFSKPEPKPTIAKKEF